MEQDFDRYTVLYDGNAGGAPVTGVPAPALVPAEESLTLPTRMPCRPCFRFLGWNTASAGTGFPYGPGDTLQVEGNMTLFAQWGEARPVCYTVTYHANGFCGGCCGEGVRRVPSPVRVEEGCPVTVSLEMPHRAGCLFTGWNTQPDGSGVTLRPGETLGYAEGDVDFYAQWRGLPCTGDMPVGPCCPLTWP